MNKSILAFSLAVSIPALAAAAGPCFGPVCVDAPVANPPDRVLCLGDFGCMPVVYETAGLFTVATVVLPNGYPVAGISGACLPGWDCPAIRDDADRDLAARLDDLHRLGRYLDQP
jgi:hypothetical protein